MGGDFLDGPQGAVSTYVPPDNELDVRPDMSPQLQTAMLLHGSGLFPNTKNAAGVFTVVQFGKEVGLPPVQALNNIAIINGKLSMSGASMLALGYRHGVTAEFTQEDEKGCVIVFSREGHKPYTSEFTIIDAEKAGLGDRDASGNLKKSSVWYKYTKTMLKWRAVAQGMRIVAPDILAGVYTADEIQNIGDDCFVAQNDTLDISDPQPTSAQKDTPEVETEAQVETDNQQKITDNQMTCLHAMISEKGVGPFREGFKMFLLTFDDTGMKAAPLTSAKDMNKSFATELIGNFDKYARTFFSSEKSNAYLNSTWTGLNKKSKGAVIAGMKTLVKGGESFPLQVKDDTSDAMVNDWFALMLTAVYNQEHNRIVDVGEEKGMTTGEVVETLEELGMNPEVKTKTEVPKQEKKQELPKDDFF